MKIFSVSQREPSYSSIYFIILLSPVYKMNNILIIGATSGIAMACARHWTTREACFYLAGRNLPKLQQISDDLLARGVKAVYIYALDMIDVENHKAMLEDSFKKLGVVDIVLIAYGSLPNQLECEQDVAIALKEFSINGLSIIALLTLLSQQMEAQKSGSIAVISSVAGDRGRPSNYLYGSAKSSVTTFCEGLRSRLFKSGVNVLTVKPGFVDTPMTQGIAIPRLLLASPDRVASDITQAIKKRKALVYAPWFWRIIMMIIRNIPDFIFKRLMI
jgi:decaprenylphospho-beta-D-erythro-pentofuranosid-2-ulose 2-reductase